MSYRIILLSEAQLARSSVWGRHKALRIENKVGGIDSGGIRSILGLQRQDECVCFTSTGLKRTELKLSTPQVNERIGLLLCSSQISTCWPQVANTASFWWWSSPVKTVWRHQSQNVIIAEVRGQRCLVLFLTERPCMSYSVQYGTEGYVFAMCC